MTSWVEAAHLGGRESEATLHLCALDAGTIFGTVTNVGHPQGLYVFPPQMSQSQPPDFSVATLVSDSLIFEAGDLANGIVKCIMDPRSKNQDGLPSAWLRAMAEGSWVHGGISIKKSPLIQKFGRNLISCQISSEKKSQDFNISTAVGHTETWLQLAVFGFGRHGRQSQRRSWSWRKSFGSDSMDQMCLDKAEDATDGPMEV